jgi:hypothetical protein
MCQIFSSIYIVDTFSIFCMCQGANLKIVHIKNKKKIFTIVYKWFIILIYKNKKIKDVWGLTKC